MTVTIEGLQEIQAANAKIQAEMKPRGALGRAVQKILLGLYQYVLQITPVDTGSWKASHRQRLTLDNKPRGVLFVDPSARNVRSAVPVTRYALKFEQGGGSYAVYGRTVREVGRSLVEQHGAGIKRSLPNGR